MADRRTICRFFDPNVTTPIPGIALDTLVLVVVQAVAIIALSKLIHLALRRHNQPTAVSQILAGVVVGSWGLHETIVHVDVDNVEDSYNGYVSVVRILYMFLVGLETDLAALRNAMGRCVALTYATVASCLLLAAVVSGGMYRSMMHSPVKTPELLAATLMMSLADTSSVSVARIVSELKLGATDSGRLVVAAAVATNIICVVGEGVFSSTALSREKNQDGSGSGRVRIGLVMIAMSATALCALRPAVAWINRRNRGQHHVLHRHLALILFAVWFVSNTPQMLGFDGMPTSFLLGLAFPREGPAARTMVDALSYPLHAMALPFYFGSIGMRLDFNSMSGAIIVPGVLLTMLGLAGKVLGAMAASAYLGIPPSDGLCFGVLLNVKGHVDTISMNFASSEGMWAEQAFYAMMISSIIGAIIAGPVVAAMFRKEKAAYASKHHALEPLDPDQELHMLGCVHSARTAPGMLCLVELLASVPREQPAVHVLHFFDVDPKRALPKPYHQRNRDRDDHDDVSSGAITQVNATVDVFSCVTGIAFRQTDAADDGAARNAGTIRRCAEDAGAGLLLLPYHKEQRFDGTMVCRREGCRQLNLDVLANAPCTVAILVDRPFRSGGIFQVPTSMSTGSESVPHSYDNNKAGAHVAAVFFGGPDDCEAVAFACRLVRHQTINLTVIRFVRRDAHYPADPVLTAAATDVDGEVALIVRDGRAADADESFMSTFHGKYVARELAVYVEKVVDGPTDVAEALHGAAEMFSLIVVGRGGRQPEELVAGLDRWAEGSEVGPVGEILASNGSLDAGSVLVVQQHNVPPPCTTWRMAGIRKQCREQLEK